MTITQKQKLHDYATKFLELGMVSAGAAGLGLIGGIGFGVADMGSVAAKVYVYGFGGGVAAIALSTVAYGITKTIQSNTSHEEQRSLTERFTDNIESTISNLRNKFISTPTNTGSKP